MKLDLQTRFSVARSRPRIFPPLSTLCSANMVGIGWIMLDIVQLEEASLSVSIRLSWMSTILSITRLSFSNVKVQKVSLEANVSARLVQVLYKTRFSYRDPDGSASS